MDNPSLMNTSHPPEVLKMLAHDLRWHMVRKLAVSDYRVNELVALIGHPANLVSYHLKKLRESQIVTTRRSDADRRDTYYSLDLERLRDLYRSAGAAIHPMLVEPTSAVLSSQSPFRVLFVCTHNSARSQMAEGLTRHLGGGQILVRSAGSEPSEMHPDAVRTMDALGIDIRDQHSKGFEEVIAQPFDAVITVCDHAREVCPNFPGEGQHIHWGFPDPAAVVDDAERRQAFMETARRLQSRISYFLHTAATGAFS